jgi:hypothetical protein
MNTLTPSRDACRSGGEIKPLNLYSMRRFESLLCMPIHQIEAIAAKAGACYSPFIKPPPVRWFPNKPITLKTRWIDNPNEELKEVQRRILTRILEPIQLPGYLKGGIKGRTLRENIEMHVNCEVLVTVDIKSFFPSIDTKWVFFLWREILNCSPRISSVLTRLTTFEGRLPQGAPTSTYLANLLVTSIDHDIVTACASQRVLYSTWVDDLAFSGTAAPLVIDTAVTSLRNAGLAVSHRKLKVMRPGSRKVLNGILVGWRLNVPFKYRNNIRSGIHKMRTGLVDQIQFDAYVRSMNGKIEHAARFNRKLGERLRVEFSREVEHQRRRLNH